MLPDCLLAGITVTVRSEPEPPNRMLPVGTKVVFDETAEILRSDGLNRASPIVNDSGPAAELVPIVWSATAAIVGGG